MVDHGKPEDCGLFCVWWYMQRDEKRWAYALRSVDGTAWRTSSPESGFASRDDARDAGIKATSTSMAIPANVIDAIDRYIATNWIEHSVYGALNAVAWIGEQIIALRKASKP